MKTNDSTALYANGFTIAEENRVRGFDPLRFVQMTAAGPKLSLKIKQTWFRLKYPEGRILLHAVNVTQQLALIEARVFLHKTDSTPQYTTTVQRMLNEVPSGLYVQAAQNAAVEQVLDEAGFTVRFNGAPVSSPAPAVQNIPMQKKAPVSQQNISVTQESKPIKEAITQVMPKKQPVQEEPVAEVSAPIEEVAPEIAVVETVAEPVIEKAAVEEPKVEVPAETVSENPPAAETVSTPVLETIPIPTAEEPVETASAEGTVLYTTSTPVEEICKLMSVEEALNYVITTGSCKGWTMAQAIARRPASVRFYTTPGYKGDDNILRASAAIVLKDLERLAKAS